MSSKKFNRIPIVIATLTILILITLWHSRDNVSEHALHYIKEKFSRRPSFYDIAMKYGTDKVSYHHYQQMYEHRLAPLHDQHVKFLEIGLGCTKEYGPGASYYTWLEYFSHVDLYYIEYDVECAAKWINETGLATVFTGDQADAQFLQKFIVESGGQFDVIIDDGGHTMDQQKTSLRVLWDAVKLGGMYCVEDLASSTMAHFGGGVGLTDTFMEELKELLDNMNKHSGDASKSSMAREVFSFEFTQECVCLTKHA